MLTTERKAMSTAWEKLVTSDSGFRFMEFEQLSSMARMNFFSPLRLFLGRGGCNYPLYFFQRQKDFRKKNFF